MDKKYLIVYKSGQPIHQFTMDEGDQKSYTPEQVLYYFVRYYSSETGIKYTDQDFKIVDNTNEDYDMNTIFPDWEPERDLAHDLGFEDETFGGENIVDDDWE